MKEASLVEKLRKMDERDQQIIVAVIDAIAAERDKQFLEAYHGASKKTQEIICDLLKV